MTPKKAEVFLPSHQANPISPTHNPFNEEEISEPNTDSERIPAEIVTLPILETTIPASSFQKNNVVTRPPAKKKTFRLRSNKERFRWDDERHAYFVQALTVLEKAQAKETAQVILNKIKEILPANNQNLFEGITREKIASHLKDHRNKIKLNQPEKTVQTISSN